MEGIDDPVFLRSLLRKVTVGPEGTARLDSAILTPGELQLCMMLAGQGMAAAMETQGGVAYLIEPRAFESLVETMANEGIQWKATRAAAG